MSVRKAPRRAAAVPAILLLATAATLLLAASAVALFAPGGQARAQPACAPDRFGNPACPPPAAQCTADRYGNPVCSPTDGGIATNRVGEVLCGRGSCVADVHGEVMCSRVPRGAAALDRNGKAACSEGCEPGSPALCVRPR